MTTQPSDEAVALFSRLFKGYEKAHGHYEINRNESGKVLGKAVTQMRGASIEDYSRHLAGVVGIGAIPLLQEDKCWFGAIDIDIKGDTKLRDKHEDLEAKIRKYKMPLMMFRSKSNGVHLYCFAKDKPISARLMQSRLNDFASILGYGGCEVFPKQVTRLQETDFGNWINLPLYGKERTGLFEGKELDTLTSLRTCDYLATTEQELMAINIVETGLFSDGPPCLQKLASSGINEGNRNNIMFNVGVYLRNKYEEDWQEHFKEFNDEHVEPSLDSKEVADLKKQLTRKAYYYTCKAAPICNFCDKKKCLTRKYGVGRGKNGDDEESHYELPINGLTKFIAGDGESYQWQLSTPEGIIRYTTEEFMTMDAHRKKFLEKLNLIIPRMKDNDLMKQLKPWVDKAEIVYDPEDASETGQMVTNIESWFTDKGSARNADELVKSKWWHNTTTNKVYFLIASLEDFLIHQKKMRGINKHKLWRILAEKFNASEDKLLISGKRRKVVELKGFDFGEKFKLQVPDVTRKEEEI